MRGDDSYAVLGLRPGAGRAEVDQAYRRLIKRYHPDHAGGDSSRAAEVNRAYSDLRARTRQPQPPPRPAPAAMARHLPRQSSSSWRGPLFALAAVAGAALLARGPAMMETAPSWPKFSSPAAGSAAAEPGRVASADPMSSLDEPLSLELIDQSVADAMRMRAADDPVLAAEFSRDCLNRLSTNPSVPLFDSCAAYDEAAAILAVGDPAVESSRFNPSAVTARQVGAARLLSADYLESESRLQQIRSRVHLVLLPQIPDNGPALERSERPGFRALPTDKSRRPPVIAQPFPAKIRPLRGFRRGRQVQPQQHARRVATQRQAPAPPRPAPTSEPRDVPAWQRPLADRPDAG